MLSRHGIDWGWFMKGKRFASVPKGTGEGGRREAIQLKYKLGSSFSSFRSFFIV